MQVMLWMCLYLSSSMDQMIPSYAIIIGVLTTDVVIIFWTRRLQFFTYWGCEIWATVYDLSHRGEQGLSGTKNFAAQFIETPCFVNRDQNYCKDGTRRVCDLKAPLRGIQVRGKNARAVKSHWFLASLRAKRHWFYRHKTPLVSWSKVSCPCERLLELQEEWIWIYFSFWNYDELFSEVPSFG